MEKHKIRQLQIMFVDNDPHVRDSLKVFFGNSDLGYLIFQSAAEALNSLKFQNMDVVISDYFLPDMDGMTFLKKVGVSYPKIKRILMATLVNNELRQELQKERIDGFIEKPLTVGFLDEVIQGEQVDH
ncbi:MAG: response regulator [Desulfobacula sp.]|nr:response regulator [Desulfobacula sp.]